MTDLDPRLLGLPFYSPEQSWEALVDETGSQSVVDLRSAGNAFGPSLLVLQELGRIGASEIRSYPGPAENHLRQRLASSLHPSLDRGNVILGNGSCDVLRMLASGLLRAHDECIMRRVDFPMYAILTQTYGGQCVLVEMNPDYTFDLASVVERITDRTRLIFISNPHNPTGQVCSQPEIDAFMAAVPASVVVVFDHAYEEYADQETFPNVIPFILAGRNVIMTRTFSKFYGLAGLRIGYGVARQELIAYLERVRLPYNTNSISARAALAALDDPEHIVRTRRLNTEGKAFLCREFDKLGFRYVASQTNFILTTGVAQDSHKLVQALRHHGIWVLAADGYNLPQAIRIAIGRPDENKRLVEALRAIKAETGCL